MTTTPAMITGTVVAGSGRFASAAQYAAAEVMLIQRISFSHQNCLFRFLRSVWCHYGAGGDAH
jgi:hypothetical protein